MSNQRLTRIAIVSTDKCKPKKCRQECKKSCHVLLLKLIVAEMGGIELTSFVRVVVAAMMVPQILGWEKEHYAICKVAEVVPLSARKAAGASSEGYAPFLQLPHFSEAVVKRIARKSKQLKKNIKRHLRTHEKRPTLERIKCEFQDCQHTFTTRSNLTQHMKALHLRAKPFSCSFPGCGMKFAFKHVRDRHESATLPFRSFCFEYS